MDFAINLRFEKVPPWIPFTGGCFAIEATRSGKRRWGSHINGVLADSCLRLAAKPIIELRVLLVKPQGGKII